MLRSGEVRIGRGKRVPGIRATGVSRVGVEVRVGPIDLIDPDYRRV